MMAPSIDFLALALLALIALIAIFLRLRFVDDEMLESFTEREQTLLYRQQQYDPAHSPLPLTGLGEDVVWGEGYLPAAINRWLLARLDAEAGDDDAAGLDAVLHPGPKIAPDRGGLRLMWTAAAFVILLGLIFLLLWMLTLI